MFGLKVLLVRRREKLTLLPCCFPFPVRSHTAILLTLFYLLFTIRIIISHFEQKVKWCIIESMDIFWIFIVFICVIFSMVIHEIMHGVVSYWLGDDTAKISGRLTLNPLRHIDPIMTIVVPILLFVSGGPIFGGAKPVPLNTRNIKGGDYGIALVALAGPLSNFFLAFLGFGIFSLFNGTNILVSQIAILFVQINLGFMIFNLIPVPPLDGSRILYAIAPEFVKNFMNQLEKYGFIIVMVFVVVFSTTLTNVIIGVEGVILNIFMGIFGV